MLKTNVMKCAVLFLICVTSELVAQRIPDFGDVSAEELKPVTYDLDSTAAAIILFDKADVRLTEEFRFSYTRHLRIKLIKKESFDEWANQIIPFEHKTQKLSKIKAATYNLENELVVTTPVDGNKMLEVAVDKYFDQVKFAFPNVKEGSVVEMSYLIQSGSTVISSWLFQHDIPTLRSEFDLLAPPFATLYEIEGGITLTDYKESKNGMKKHWGMRNIPAFKPEPFSLTPRDLVSRLHLKFMAAHGLMADAFRMAFDSERKKEAGYLSNMARKVVDSAATAKVKIDSIYNFVKRKVKWNGHIDRFPDRSFSKVITAGTGSSAEINLLLVCLLEASGLKSSPVLVSTRDHGRININSLALSQFNDVACLVTLKDKRLLLDGTDEDLPQSYLPKRYLNGMGLAISADRWDWIPMVSSKDRTVVDANLKISPEEKAIIGDLVVSRNGITGSEITKSVKGTDIEKYLQETYGGKEVRIVKGEFQRADRNGLAPREKLKVLSENSLQVSNGVIYLNPFIMGRSGMEVFKSELRKYTIDFSPSFDEFYIARIRIPEGYSVEELPKSISFSLTDNSARFVYSLTASDSTINLSSQLMFNRAVFEADEYPVVREFYGRVLAKQAEQIVLKKGKD